MRKQVFGRHLGRTKNQRQALFRALITSLVEKGEIETTLAKAKAVKAESEKLITKAKSGGLTDRRMIFRTLNRKALVNKLVETMAPLLKERKGGYLRIVRTGVRKGDNAMMAKLMFVETMPSTVREEKPKEKKEKIVSEPEKIKEKVKPKKGKSK